MATALKPTTPNRAARVRVAQQIERLRVAVATDIASAIEALGITQHEAYGLTGQQASQISLICSGKLHGFSLERLIEIRALLGASVAVTITDGESAAVKVSVK